MARRSSNRRNASAAAPAERSVAAHVRDRQRAVAEREAARLARPEVRAVSVLAHADRKKSAVSSTPTGIFSGAARQLPPQNEEWCGPFSVARDMIKKREEAKREREEEQEDNGMHHPLDAAMEELEMEKKRRAHPSMQWKGSLKDPTNNSGGSLYTKRQKRTDLLHKGRAVPSLFDLCVKFLVDNFDHVESLGDIDSQIRTAITNELIALQKLNGASFPAIAEAGIEALEVVDCSGITETELTARLQVLVPGLRYLALDQAGRCFDEKAVDACCHDSIFALSIGGAYLLRDADAAKLVKSCQPSALEFKACPLLGRGLCESIRHLPQLLELALEDLSLSPDDLQVLTAGSFGNLKSLSLRRIDGLSDELVTEMVKKAAASLEGLDLSDNLQLTDAVLAGIRLHGPGRLHALNLAGIKQLTDAGLQAFFTFVDGASPPPMLRTLDLSNCDDEAVTDDVLQLALVAATQSHESDQVSLTGGLVRLNVQGSSALTDSAMEHLAATSAKTIQELSVSFCPGISDKGLGHLVDNADKQLCKIQVWGNAQITDEFLDGHHRSMDAGLEIVGVWMKQNTSRTIR